MASLGELRYELVIDASSGDAALKSLDKNIDKVEENLKNLDKQAAKTQEAFKNKLVSGLKAGSTAVATFVAGLGAATIALGVKSVQAASNLQESMNAVNVTFGEAADIINEFGENSVKQAGLSRRAFNEAVVPIGAMLQNMGQSAEDAANSSVQLAQRAADLASVFNTDLNQAITAIQAGLRGEADPLERFGVGLSETAVQAYAVKEGIAAAGSELTAQQKSVARLGLLFQQTNKFAGDFVNTSDGLANSQRIAAASLEEVQAQIGEKLIPAVKRVRDALGASLVEFWNDNSEAILNLAETIGNFVAGALTALIEAGSKIVKFLSENKEAVIILAGALTAALIPAFVALASAIAPAVAAMTAAAAAGAAFAAFGVQIVKSINGLIGGLDDISNATEETTRAIKDMAGEGAADIAALSIEGQNAFRELALNGGKFTDDLATDVLDNTTAMSAAFDKEIRTMITEATKSLQDLKDAGKISLEEYNQGIKNLNATAAEMQRVNDEAAKSIGELTLEAQKLQQSIDGGSLSGDTLAATQTELDGILDQIAEAQKTMSENALKAAVDTNEQLLGIQQRLANDMARINADQVEEIIGKTNEQKEAAVAAATAQYEETLAEAEKLRLVGAISDEVANEIVKNATEQRDKSIQMAQETSSTILTNVQQYANQRGLIFDREDGKLLTKQELFWKSVKEAPVGLLKAMYDFVKGFLKLFGEMIGTGLKAMFAIIKALFNAGVEMVKNWVDGVKFIIQTAIPWLLQKGKEWGKAIMDGLAALPGQMLQFGKDTVQGFIDGLTSMFTTAISNVTEFGNKIIGAVKSTLGIQSPSKVFREFGNNTAEGFLIGFEEESPESIKAMNRFVVGLNKETAKLNKSDLDYTDALQELEGLLQDTFDNAADAIREFVNINQDAQKQIRSDIKETETAITDLQTAFAKTQAADKQNFVSDAAGIVIEAQNELAKLQQELADLNQQRNEASNKGENTANIDKEIADIQAQIAQKNSILQTAADFEVNLDAEIKKQKDFNALNELQQLQVRFDEEKALKEAAYQEELLQLEQRKADLEANLAEQEQIFRDFTAQLDTINKDFTAVYQDELTKREQLTKSSVDNLVAQYQRLAAAAQAARSAGANIGGVSTGAGFAEGGYTGDGSKNEIAGIVHKGEYVVPAWLSKAAPGLFGMLEGMRQAGQQAVTHNNQKSFNFQVTSNNQGAADPYRDMNYMRWISGYAF